MAADTDKVEALKGPDGLITLVGADGKKYRKPAHYLDNPALGDWKLPPSSRKRKAEEPATPANARVQEPATPETEKEASA